MNEARFKELFEEYWEELYAYVFKILGDKEISQDLIQEIYFSLWKNRKSITIQNPKAYLYQSLRFQIYKHFRDNHLKCMDIEDFSDFIENYGPEEIFRAQEINTALHQSLDKLPPKCRKVYELSRFEEFSNREIAESLKISKNTVKNHLSKATSIIRVYFNNYFTSQVGLVSALYHLLK